jgi:hypothetical protein
MMRRVYQPVHSPDRSVLQLQEEVASIRRQLSETRKAPNWQTTQGDNRGNFGQTGRGLYQTHFNVVSLEFLTASAINYLIYATQPLELTGAYWIPDADYALSPQGIPSLKIRDHVEPYDKSPAEGPELAYISGEDVTAGPWATGALRRGQPYKFRLGEKPSIKVNSIVTMIQNTTNAAAKWPDGNVILLWRYL